jgi:protein-tyrosine phosphatase
VRNLQKLFQQNNGHQRVVAFKGASNFRDLGGYSTESGSSVKWGVLYRSGHLAKMKSVDLKRFAALNIHTLIDFRSDQEREKDPNRLPFSQDINIISLPILNPFDASWAQELRVAIESKNLQSFDPSQEMLDFYRSFVIENTDQYKKFIHAVLGAQGKPVLWHCTAGKDRTGFAAALLLRTLGVQHDIVVEDYLMSTEYVNRRKPLLFMLHLTRGKLFADSIQALMLVQKEWIETAFKSIDESWGSFGRYCHEALELSGEQINKLRHSLLDNTVNQ